jgi:hypothetical protein
MVKRIQKLDILNSETPNSYDVHNSSILHFLNSTFSTLEIFLILCFAKIPQKIDKFAPYKKMGTIHFCQSKKKESEKRKRTSYKGKTGVVDPQ